ncbi:site-specific DNA-methyltransferase [Chitinimonas sp. PSY-7]|uniref:DNA methyltransferase n=1 Tax=Chitinimonas sp. PSY-7 TaxID=3459088 RepID=UPI00403FF2E3
MESLQTQYPNIEARALESIAPYARNPRSHPEEQIAKLVASLREFGWTFPILIDETGEVIAGHGKLIAAQRVDKYGWDIPNWPDTTTVPVLVKSDLTPEQRRAYRILDNKIAEESEWVEDLLALELKSLAESGFDLALTGFDAKEAKRLANTLNNLPDLAANGEENIPEVPVNPFTRRGDLWLLGEHRLLCGDSTNPVDVIRLMNGERAALFATDPPYLVDYDGTNHPRDHNKKGTPQSNPDEPHWDASSQGQAFFDQFIDVAVKHAINDNVAWYCWHASRRQAMLEAAWEKADAFVHQQIIWAKSRGVLTHSVYLWAHEPCFFGWRKGRKPNVNREDFEGWPTTIWEIPRGEVETTDHPTSKPVRVFTLPIQLHTEPGDICYEPFSGSGSQLMAGQRTGRAVYGMEMSEAYCDVIIRRWQQE